METSQQLVSQKKYVYMFHEGNAQMKDLLGGKGANLAEMTRLGLPIPQGFTITTEACNAYYANGKQFPDGLKEQVEQALKELERITGKKFGDKENPLLVSVRSGAPVSMPGMMDTILNLGLNDETVEGLAKKTNNRRFALDCYRRLIQMFGNVVLKIDHEKFEKELERVKEIENVQYDHELSEQALSTVVNSFKRLIKQETGKDFPQDPMEQLYMAIKAVFDSWNNKRAIKYREVNKIPHNLGTAANVQVMVFGNMGENSGTGVAFTRNPANGNKELYGEYLMNAQGEDVVAGIRTPLPVSKLKEQNEDLYNQFVEICDKLERHYRDMQDIEFTIEEGKLFILQTRTGKRTASAAVKIAVDMVKEGIIDKEEAIMRITPEQVDQLLHPRIDPNAHYEVLAKGLNASPGAASGAVVFDPDSAEKLAKSGKKVILVRPETTPEDIHGIVAAEGVLTSRGGATSHAAVVARGIGKPCVVGCEDIKIDLEKKRFTVGEVVVSEGDIITIDGSTGEVILGAVPLTHPEFSEEFKTLLRWADDIRKLGVRANADTPEMAMLAIKFGAEGIGLCRTERMFNAPDRMPIMRAMIIAGSEEERKKQIEKLRPMQKEDFKEMLRIMGDRPMIVRLLDPPLHEFMPSPEELLNEIFALKEKGKKDDDPEVVERKRLLKRVKELQEINPMLGHRGVRLGMTYPYIYEMQIRALLEAAAEV
ncbi:MAG: pyruvate, phosphate dikinase, partial [Thermoplasmata archaeon]